METKFCLRLIKETYVDAKSYEEACQLAEMLATRECDNTMFGNLVTIVTEVEELITK